METMANMTVKVYDPGLPGFVECTLLNQSELSTLATWLCERTCRHFGDKQRKTQIDKNGGHCDECLNEAGFLLTECPFINMATPRRIQ
jgi:hypothetical protein